MSKDLSFLTAQEQSMALFAAISYTTDKNADKYLKKIEELVQARCLSLAEQQRNLNLR